MIIKYNLEDKFCKIKSFEFQDSTLSLQGTDINQLFELTIHINDNRKYVMNLNKTSNFEALFGLVNSFDNRYYFSKKAEEFFLKAFDKYKKLNNFK